MRTLALAALLAAFPVHAQMFKCVDERGVTTYTDKPRPDCKGGKVDIQGQPPISGAVAPGAKPPSNAEQDAEFRRRQAQRERAEAADQSQLLHNCARLRQEQTWLSSGGRISEIDAKGQRNYVDEATRNARLQQVRDQLRACP